MIKFTQGPSGRFGLAYVAGDVAEFTPELEAEIIEAGYAEKVGEETKEQSEETTSEEVEVKPKKKKNA